MHGGHLVEEFRLNQLQSRLEQFRSDHQCHQSTDQEHAQTENQIHASDVFVVRGEQPTPKALRGTMMVRIVVVIFNVWKIDIYSRHQ